MKDKVLLCIMDGWGLNGDCEKDAVKAANTPNFDRLRDEELYTTLRADGEHVGLPEGQMGNSEVGHLNLGAGRTVYQELSRINKSIKDGDFFRNPEFLNAIKHVKANDSALHLYGLVSDGGVHSTITHILALMELAHKEGIKKVYIHAFLDGRDTPPKSAQKYIDIIEKKAKELKLPAIASIMGRYWAMDRDNRWDRIEKAYNCLVEGYSAKAKTAKEALETAYAAGKTDEFIPPTMIGGLETRIKDNDAIIFFNFRPDRAREISKALLFEDFKGFERIEKPENLYYVTMTQYDETFSFPVAFPPERLKNILGDILQKNGIKQFRTAETEKYAHVTFFFNGGVEEPYALETRVLVPSPKVATYDMQPEMSAESVCDEVLKALNDKEYKFILVNFANPDMVGHTGVFDAAVKACEKVDECIGKIAEKCKKKDVVMLLTADHGNAECMENPKTHTPYTAHTTNPVPLILINSDAGILGSGALCDVAPTILDILKLQKPDEMTGHSLIK